MQPLTLVCLLRFRVQVEEDAALIMNSIQRCITLVRERSHPVVINTDDLQTSFCALPHSYLVMRPRHVTRASPACPRIILHPGTMERRQLPHLTSSLAPVITPLARLLLGLRPAVKRSRPVQVHHPTPLADSPRPPPPPQPRTCSALSLELSCLNPSGLISVRALIAVPLGFGVTLSPNSSWPQGDSSQYLQYGYELNRYDFSAIKPLVLRDPSSLHIFYAFIPSSPPNQMPCSNNPRAQIDHQQSARRTPSPSWRTCRLFAPGSGAQTYCSPACSKRPLDFGQIVQRCRVDIG